MADDVRVQPAEYHYADSAPAQPNGGQPMQYLLTLRRRFWVIIACMIVAVTIGAVKVSSVPRVYRTAAKVMVERKAGRVMQFEGVQADAGWYNPEYYATQEGLVRSRVVMDIALEAPEISVLFTSPTNLPIAQVSSESWLGELRKTMRALIGTTPDRPPEPWEMLRNEISTEMVRNTHFLMVGTGGTDPRRAALVANAVANAFVAYHVQSQVEALGDAFAYLQREKQKEEKELQRAEAEIQAFREKTQTVATSSGGDHQPAQARLVELNGRLTQVQLARTGLNAKIHVMRRLVSETNEVTALDRMFSIPMVDSDSNLATLRNSLVNARKELVLLSETYGPAHPKYRNALASEQALQIEFRDMLGQSIISDDKRREVLEGEEIELQLLYDEERKTAIEGARDTFTMIHLQNAVERHRKLFDALVQRMLEVDISSGFSKTAVEVVEPACIPTSPINPRKGERLAVFLFMGLFLGVAAAFFLENLDDTIKTPEDLKQMVGIPLLGFIPAVAMPREPKVDKDFVYRGRMALFEPMSSVSEAYRNTRTNLFYSAPADELKVLGITSSTPQEGKTTTSANMAIVIAQSGRKVLLVDADLHRPMIHKVFGLGSECGLTTVLVGEADAKAAIRQVFHEGEAVPNLYVLPAGPSSPNPAELLGSKRMKDLLESQRKEYDWILIDTPPVLFVSDASIVAALCDAVLFVVKAGSGNRTVLRRTREQLTNVRCRILGGILNNMKVSRVGRHYSDYYYHGYARYAKDYHRAYYGKKGQDS